MISKLTVQKIYLKIFNSIHVLGLTFFNENFYVAIDNQFPVLVANLEHMVRICCTN